MKISGVNVQQGQTGGYMMTDSVSRNLQSQIASVKKQLQDLSSNEEMSMEEKMKKRQELQQQITELNQQLRQHEIELRREKQQEKAASREEQSNAAGKTSAPERGLSRASMQAMISADTAIEQAQVQEGVSISMEGRARVLVAEIKLDAGRGGNVEAKQEELADVEQKAKDAKAAQTDILGEANKTLKEAQESDRSTEKTEESDEKKASGKEKERDEAGNVSDSGKEQKPVEKANVKEREKEAAEYMPVDIRL